MATPRALIDSSSSAGLLSVIAHASDPMLLADVPAVSGDDARVVAVNKAFCRLSARQTPDVIEQGWLTLCGAGVDAPLIDRIKRALYRREHLVVDLPLARADGLDVWTQCELLPVRDARGLATAILIIQRDISEQKQTRGMLSSLRAMTRRASHDVNNGLASVIINLSLGSSTRATEDERTERIRDALNAARDAAETAKRLSALASNLEAPPVDAVDASADDARESDAESAAALREATPSPDEIGSLLILDDDASVKELLAVYLGDRGYKVDATCESETCIETYRKAFTTGHPFDLVMLDLRVGGDDDRGGLRTLAALKAIDPRVKAIVHSGYSTDDVMLNPRKFGFVAAIKKPTAPSEIGRLLADLIHVHAAGRRLDAGNRV
jgi:PAS domain S-box-containing protein